MALVTTAGHRLVRGAALVAALAAPAWRLARSAPGTEPPASRLVALPAPTDEARGDARALFATADPDADAAPADAPVLVGIAGRLPVDGIALLRQADGITRAVAVGQAVDGWRVAAIAADRVRLVQGARVRDEVLPPRDGQ